jgi:hypothetical protein
MKIIYWILLAHTHATSHTLMSPMMSWEYTTPQMAVLPLRMFSWELRRVTNHLTFAFPES